MLTLPERPASEVEVRMLALLEPGRRVVLVPKSEAVSPSTLVPLETLPPAAERSISISGLRVSARWDQNSSRARSLRRMALYCCTAMSWRLASLLCASVDR